MFRSYLCSKKILKYEHLLQNHSRIAQFDFERLGGVFCNYLEYIQLPLEKATICFEKSEPRPFETTSTDDQKSPNSL